MDQWGGQAAAQLGAAIAWVRALEHAQDLPQFRQRALAVEGLVGGNHASYNEIDLDAGQATVVLRADNPRFDGDGEVFRRWMHQHPVVTHMEQTGDLRPRSLSDFLTETELHALELYRRFFSRLQVEDQIALGLPARPGLTLGLAVSRDSRGFSATERTLLAAVTPFAGQAYLLAGGRERARALMSDRASSIPWGGTIVVVDTYSIVLACGEQAAELISRYLGEALVLGQKLPPKLYRFIAHQRRLVQGRCDLREPPAAADISGPNARLLIRLIPAAEDDLDALLLEERDEPLAVDRTAEAGLTPRQMQVARLLVEGHTNAQIARSLYLSPSTVKRHLEAIYSRLGVSSRAAAAANLVGSAPAQAPDR